MEALNQQNPQELSLLELARNKIFELYEECDIFEYFSGLTHNIFTEDQSNRALYSTLPDVTEETGFNYIEYPDDIWNHIADALYAFYPNRPEYLYEDAMYWTLNGSEYLNIFHHGMNEMYLTHNCNHYAISWLTWISYHRMRKNLTNDWIVDMKMFFIASENLLDKFFKLPFLYKSECTLCPHWACDHPYCRSDVEEAYSWYKLYYSVDRYRSLFSFKEFKDYTFSFEGPDQRLFSGKFEPREEYHRVIPSHPIAIADSFDPLYSMETDMVPSGIEEDIEEELSKPIQRLAQKTLRIINEHQRKVSKFTEKRQQAKMDRQVKHKLRKQAYKIERQLAREGKQAIPSGLVSNSYQALIHSLRAVLAAFGKYHEKSIVDQWIVICITMCSSPNVSGLISVFAQMMGLVGISISTVLKEIAHYAWEFLDASITKAHNAARSASETIFNYLYSPSQPQEGSVSRDAEPSGFEETFYESVNCIKDTGDKLFKYVEKFGANSPALLAAVVAGASATFAAYLVGTSPTNAAFRVSRWDKLIAGCQNFAKFKSGAYAFQSFIKDFCTWTYDFVERNTMHGVDSQLVQMINGIDLEDDVTKSLEKRYFFEYYYYITNAVNLQSVMVDPKWRERLQYVEKVLTIVQRELFDDNANAESRTLLQNVNLMLKEIKTISKSTFKNHVDNFSRFRPAVFMLTGKAGCGKSVFQTYFTNMMLSVLKTQAEFGVPESTGDQLVTVNFGDKYLTGYKGQYCVVVDDIFQDADGALEGTSSALQFINWISNAPFATNQADLESKGIQFVSKMVVASSNCDVPTSKAIKSQDALLRRLDYQIRFIPTETAKSDPLLGNKKVRLELYQPAETTPGTWTMQHVKTFDNAEHAIEEAIAHYIQYYRREQGILESRTPKVEDIERICQKLLPNRQATPSGMSVSKMRTGIAMWFYGHLATMTLRSGLKQIHNVNNEIAQEVLDRFGASVFDPEFIQREIHDYSDFIKVAEINQWIIKDGTRYVEGSNYSGIEVAGIKESIDSLLLLCSKIECEETLALVIANKAPIFRSDTWTYYSSKFKQVKDRLLNSKYGKLLLVIGSAAAMFAGAKYMIGDFKKTKVADEDIAIDCPTGIRYETGRPRRITRQSKLRSAFASGDEDIFDARQDKCSDDILKMLIDKATVCKIGYQVGNVRYSQNAVRIRGRAILTNAHFFSSLREARKAQQEEPEIFFLVNMNGAIKVVSEYFDENRLVELPGKDLAVYNCVATMPEARCILEHFPQANDDLPNSIRFRLLKAPPRETASYVVVESPTGMIASLYEEGAIYSTKERTFSMGLAWHSHLRGQLGDSGSLMIAESRAMQKKIIGMQCAISRNGNETWFEPVCREDLEIACDRLKVSKEVTTPKVDDVIASLGVECDDRVPECIGKESLIYVGTVPKTKAMAPPGKTKLIKSLIYNPETSKMQPAVLRKTDPRLETPVENLLAHNVQGFDHHYGAVDTEVLNEATSELSVYLASAYSANNIAPRLLTENETVNGIPGVLKEVDMHTSPGYPFVKQRKLPHMQGKFEWFEEHEEVGTGRKLYTMKSEIRSRFELREEAARKGQRLHDSFGYMCLKDEKRKMEKIRQGKTRVFICLPMDYNLLTRKYFGAFVAAQHQKAAQPGIASSVGIDPLGSWNTIFRTLNEKSTQWEDFDYTNWDQSLHPEFFGRYAEIVSEFYGDSLDSPEHKVRCVLMHELCYTYLIMGDRLVLKTGGQCSGCAVTAEINCVIHELLMLYSYKLYHKRNGNVRYLTDFLEMCAIKVYGDDILFSIRPEDGFCGAEHRKIAEEIGMRITTAQKDYNFRVKAPKDCTFLKRSFVHDDRFGVILCPMDKTVIEEIPMWIHKSDSELDATIENINSALLEAFLCGRDYYNSLRRHYAQLVDSIKIGSSGSLNTYEYYLNQYISKDFKVLCLRGDGVQGGA
jgi:hypothetical protein